MEKIEVTMPLYEIRLSVTGACNQQCIYCGPFSDGRGNNGYGELSVGQIEEILPLLRKNNLHVQLTGGEPTLRLDLLKIVSKLKEGGLADIGLTTNCSMIDVDRAVKLVEAGIVDIHVHVPSFNSEIFQKTTGNLNKGVIENFKQVGIYLAKTGCRIEFNTPVTCLNEETMDALCDFCFVNKINLKLIEEVNIKQRQIGVNKIVVNLEKWLSKNGVSLEPEKINKKYGYIYDFGEFSFRIALATRGLAEYLAGNCDVILYDGRYWMGGSNEQFLFSPSCFSRPQVGTLRDLENNFNNVKDFYENYKK